MTKLAHLLVKKTAVEIASEAYEELARDNVFFKTYPTRESYIRQNLSQFIQVARQTLAKMLDGNYPESQKDIIFKALLKQNRLPKGGNIVSNPNVTSAH